MRETSNIEELIRINIKYTAIALVVVVVCASAAGYLYYRGIFNTSPSPRELRVFIASSLIYVVQNMSQIFEQANNCKIVVNSAGSNTLYQQIITGSPCDVFMSADFKWTKQLKTQKLLYNDNYQNFTSNTLIVILPKDNSKNITSLLDLIKPGVKIVMPDPTIPSGSYANKTLTKIDQTWGNPNSTQYLGPDWQNYKAKLSANVVSYELQVEDVVGKVASGLGTADAGIAFVSDATARGSQLKYVQISSAVNTKGIYGIAVINGTSQADPASKFMNYWLSTDGQNLLQTFGFGT